MIESVSLVDFLSHRETTIRLGSDASVFVGSNGAGKSSVVDAITFALFGRHTRKNNRGLVRRGSNSALARVVFAVDGTVYRAERRVGLRGETGASLHVRADSDDWQVVITGERREFGESMTKKVEEILGMDYEQMLIAGIVQQGELVSIIEEKPKKFKETLNEIIGIDRLDAASLGMAEAIKDFRAGLRQSVGYDDLAAPQLESECVRHGSEKVQLEPRLKELEKKMAGAERDASGLKAQLESGREKLEYAARLRACREELVRHVKDVIERMRQEVESDRKKMTECSRCLQICEQTAGAQEELERAREQEQMGKKSVQDLRSNLAGLEERARLAGSLRLTDGRCPVCDSQVKSLKPIYDENLLRDAISEANSRIKAAAENVSHLESERELAAERLESGRRARSDLDRHQVADSDGVEMLRKTILERQTALEGLPESGMLRAESVGAEFAIDERSRQLYGMAEDLVSKVAGFDEGAFKKIQKSLETAEERMLAAQRDLGAGTEALKRVCGQMDAKSAALEQLGDAARLVSDLERVRDLVYGRDGHVATSLRSWALESISRQATEYLDMFDTKVRRIELEEKKKDFTIKCYSGTSEMDIKSLSGGERVCVALAMRLGMASAFGASRLNCVILDEPTAYLDAEKKSAMVQAITRRPDPQNGSQVQLVIISHDREIFENTAVERVYSFEQDGSLPDSPTVVKPSRR